MVRTEQARPGQEATIHGQPGRPGAAPVLRIGRGGWWLTFHPHRAALAAFAAVVVVSVVALTMKGLVENLSSLSYEIHWLETVPPLVVLFFLLFNRMLNEADAPIRRPVATQAGRPDDPLDRTQRDPEP